VKSKGENENGKPAKPYDMSRHMQILRSLTSKVDRANFDDDGIYEGNGKWFRMSIASYYLWHEHLEGGGHEDFWTHDSLGYWVLFELSEEEKRTLTYPNEHTHLLIHERDDGIMEEQWFTATEVQEARRRLDELCNPEPEGEADDE
jgi:hypothetical protein